MSQTKISASDLIKLLPEEELALLGHSTGVDFKVKKLSGKTVLQLLMFGLLSGKEISWRILEILTTNSRFQRFADLPVKFSADHSSMGKLEEKPGIPII